MDNKPCRDCGYLLEVNARGCPRCAMNVQAEAMIDRVVWSVVILAVVVAGLGVTYLILR
jgi:hypothetical protein